MSAPARTRTTRSATTTGTRRTRGGKDSHLHYFQLTPKQLASVRNGRGRRTAPSELEPDVKDAIANHDGEYIGFKITSERTPNWIIGQLRKAARAQGLETKDYSIFNREAEGFVAFQPHVRE